MNKEKGRINGSETNTNNTTRNRLIGTAAAVAAGAGILAGLAHDTDKGTSREDAQIEIVASQIGIDTDDAHLLRRLQKANEGIPSEGTAVNEIPLSSLKLLRTGDVTIAEGDTLFEVALDEYERFAGEVSESASESAKFTIEMLQRDRQEKGESNTLQPGDTFGLTFVEDREGNDLVVVSDPTVLDTN